MKDWYSLKIQKIENGIMVKLNHQDTPLFDGLTFYVKDLNELREYLNNFVDKLENE